MNYDDYSYLYPPRPEKAIPRELIAFYQNRGWVGQIKKNGTFNVIFVKGDQVIFKTRHADDHKMWSPKPDHIKFFQSQKYKKWTVFLSELVHSKTPGIKDQIYIHDIIVWDGQFLVNSTFAERQERLQGLWKGKDEEYQTRINNYISVAKNITHSLVKVFDAIDDPKVNEGLVLKNPQGKLKTCFHATSNSSWQVKARKFAANYSF